MRSAAPCLRERRNARSTPAVPLVYELEEQVMRYTILGVIAGALLAGCAAHPAKVEAGDGTLREQLIALEKNNRGSPGRSAMAHSSRRSCPTITWNSVRKARAASQRSSPSSAARYARCAATTSINSA